MNELFLKVAEIFAQKNILICYFSFFDKNKSIKYRIYASKEDKNEEKKIYDILDEKGKYVIYDNLEDALKSMINYLEKDDEF